ncbi:bifunctional nicotinamidase/pyrazinamidase [Geovibrio sp. ADMFC3]|jgi:nicotinamidase/pyrazinamidase
MTHGKNTALIVVDVQNDFCPGGALAVKNGNRVVSVINSLVDSFEITIGTQDWHPVNHGSFASSNEGTEPFSVQTLNGIEQVMWPDHCIQGTHGADFHPDLHADAFHVVIRKGANPDIDSYSAFTENDGVTVTGLKGCLKELGVTKVYVTGLATDFCVMYTALDAVKAGFETYVIEDACKGVDFPEGNVVKALSAMKEAGVRIVQSADVRL